MYLIDAVKMAVCLVDRTDDDVSQNHCVSNCSSTKTFSCSNLSQHILTMIICKTGNLTFSFCEICHAQERIELMSLLQENN